MVGDVQVKKLPEHLLRFLGQYDLGAGILCQYSCQGAGVIGLHMVHEHIVERPAAEAIPESLQEGFALRPVHGVQERRLLVEEQVGIVADAARDGINVFKQRQTVVVLAQIKIIVIDSLQHKCNLLYTIQVCCLYGHRFHRRSA